jgi:hypothetical protein
MDLVVAAAVTRLQAYDGKGIHSLACVSLPRCLTVLSFQHVLTRTA